MLNELGQPNLAVEKPPALRQVADPSMESPLIEMKRDGHNPFSANYAGKLALQERPFLDLVTLRGEKDDPRFATVIRDKLGGELPITANTFRDGESYRVIWLGPDEWLAQSRKPQRASIEACILASFADLFASAVDVSSGYTTLSLSGRHAAEALARGCPLDLHPSVFGPGQCAQSYFFKAAILLLATGPEQWELVVRRSFAEYVVSMLVDTVGA
ncbi:sarcosine oxidase subunit gamma family protein [Paraburkholderia sp. MPAMCS5]|uniref:sarcosine oxidase subunit gamma n=1 Tax=Paraburkholderia sp. MPAMCS5 TaxID=3112563 RepID=UPI002E177471|nr:sarcosine oxidase subunit gamma family protein [Paraburkholderia sp. MPAMCS5]